MDIQFLRSVSIILFAIAVAVFFTYTTRLVGKPIINFVLVTSIVTLTYLNFTLATQIRAYSLYLLVSVGYFIIVHQLLASPRRAQLLLTQVFLGVLMLYAHNFGLFYLAASGAFVGLLFLWSRDRRYMLVLASHALIVVIWFITWYPSFRIQTEAGKPHSWIPLPTFLSFFRTVGELVPTISQTLEYKPAFFWLPILRFVLLVGLFLYIAVPKLRKGFRTTVNDPAFSFYLLSGFVYLTTITIALVVSFTHTSVFISRYLWPSHLLMVYQLVYAYHHFVGSRITLNMPRLARLMPLYVVLLTALMFYQNKKLPIYPSTFFNLISKANKGYPIYIESAYNFLPAWFYHKDWQPRYLLNWETASYENNTLSATVEYKILKSLKEKYGVPNIVTNEDFQKEKPSRFYVIDEDRHYQFEHYFKTGQVAIIDSIPIGVAGHRLLQCTRLPSPSAPKTATTPTIVQR